jgi:hypothetical protein
MKMRDLLGTILEIIISEPEFSNHDISIHSGSEMSCANIVIDRRDVIYLAYLSGQASSLGKGFYITDETWNIFDGPYSLEGPEEEDLQKLYDRLRQKLRKALARAYSYQLKSLPLQRFS